MTTARKDEVLRSLAALTEEAVGQAEAGHGERAVEQLRTVAEECERIFGPKHPQTFRSQANLASFVGQCGDPATARNLLDQLSERVASSFGPSHPESLLVAGNAAAFRGIAGDPAGAAERMRALQPAVAAVFGADSEEARRLSVNLAAWESRVGGREQVGDDAHVRVRVSESRG